MRRADLALDDNASTPYLPTLPTSYLHACAYAPADEPCTGAGVVSSYICSKCIRRNVADSSLCVCVCVRVCACVCDEGAEMRCCQVGHPIRAVEWRVARSMSLLPISASTSLPVTQLILPASSFSLAALHTLLPHGMLPLAAVSASRSPTTNTSPKGFPLIRTYNPFSAPPASPYQHTHPAPEFSTTPDLHPATSPDTLEYCPICWRFPESATISDHYCSSPPPTRGVRSGSPWT